ncbi:MAG: glycosyltransferase involved in cell wall biosynthesis [Arenicella sp.]
MNILPLVSIIVPTRDRLDLLEKCLGSIAKQYYQNIEVIIVDGQANEPATTVALTHNATYLMVNKSGDQRSAQRNLGFAKARGDYLMYIDDDMTLEPEVVQQCVELSLQNPEVGAIVIHEKSFGKGFWIQCKILERSCYEGDRQIEGVRFIRKDVLDQIGGFNVRLIAGEDWDITHRIQQADFATPAISAYIHHNEGSAGYFEMCRKKMYYGGMLPAFVQESTKPREGFMFLLQRVYFFRSALWRNWRKILSQPAQAIGLVLLLSGELVAGGLGYIAGSMRRVPKE